MGQPKRFTISNLAGGLNTGADLTDLNDNEFVDLQNWFPWTVRLRRRSGTTRVSGTPASPNGRFHENISNAAAYKSNVGDFSLMVGGLTSVGQLTNSALVTIPHLQGTTYTSDTTPWSFRQFKNVMYAARPNAGTLQRIVDGTVDDAGIVAPSTAPTLADGGAGNIAAGDYYGVFTYYNSVTGAESNPSPTSASLTLGSNKQVTWSGVTTSSNAQVDSRRLYRTLKDSEGVYFLAATISDNISTSQTENSIQAELGVQASFDNALPPSTVEMLETWFERAWISDGSRLYYSEFLLPESYSEFSVLDINPDDGESMTGILNFGDILIVGKTNSTHFVSTVDGFSFRVQALSREHGVRSHESMKAAEGRAFWFGGDNFYATDGATVRAIGDVQIRTIVDSIDPSDYPLITSAIEESLGWYLACIPTLGKIICFNYRSNVWTVFTMRLADNSVGSPSFITDFTDSDERPVLYCNLQGGDSDSVFQFNSGNTDDGRNIECSLTTKYFGFDEEPSLKIVGDVQYQITPKPGTMTITLMGDDSAVLAGPIDVSTYGTRQWFRTSLASNGNPAAGIALKLEYSGLQNLDVLGFGFSITDLERYVPVSAHI